MTYTKDQKVEIRWMDDLWLPATIQRVYDNGADVIVNTAQAHTSGLTYLKFEDIRTP